MGTEEDLIKRLNEDDRYQKVLETASDEMRPHIVKIVEGFMKKLAPGMDTLREQLQDPEKRRAFEEALKDRGRK